MKSKLMVTAVLFSIMVLSGSLPVFAQEEPMDAVSAVVNVGNKICPVSNEAIEEGKAVEVEYNGKVYSLCCAACVQDFNADPEKYVKIVEEAMAQEIDLP